MIPINYLKVTNLQKKYKTELDGHAQTFVQNLRALRVSLNEPDEKKYVDTLIRKGPKLIYSTPDDFDSIKNDFDGILKFVKGNKRHQKFKNKILNALGYKVRRTGFYPKYFAALGIKACVYCNSQLCVSVVKHNRALIGKFQVDHFISKNLYPCLSVALFNLYPVCGSCNNIKGTKEVAFKLYEKNNTPLISKYKFCIEDLEKTVADYLTTRDSKVITLSFVESDPGVGIPSMDSVFSITGIYATQKDLIEDLILKSHIYNNEYKAELVSEYKALFPDQNVLHRLILGNYTEPEEIHQRPMSKFMQDIGKQLGLI